MLVTSNAAAVMLIIGQVHIGRIYVAKIQNTVNQTKRLPITLGWMGDVCLDLLSHI